MRIEIKMHRLLVYGVWFVVTPCMLLGLFMSPMWSPWFWRLGGWAWDETTCIHATAITLWLLLVALNVTATIVRALRVEDGRW